MKRNNSHEIQPDLIFDLGLHKGFDSEFYLKKGFRVIALEAVPSLCAIAQARLSDFSDNLTIVNKALWKKAGERVSFYTVPEKDDWGSLERGTAEKGVQNSVEIEVETISLDRLFDLFGVPYYIKCDLEGGDIIFREQLLADERRPTFVSLEMNDGNEGEVLAQAGYQFGQIVNQWMNPFKIPPNPPHEGAYVPVSFHAEMSGLFGKELDRPKWLPLSEIDDLYRQWRSLNLRDNNLAPGWLDLHACSASALGAP